MKSKITSIGTAVPAYKITQQQALDFMVKINDFNLEQRHGLEVLYRASGIQSRHTVLEDYTKLEGFDFYPNNNSRSLPSTKDRMRTYYSEAIKLSVVATSDCIGQSNIELSEITHLVTVSCTGMHAPGLDLELIEHLGLKNTIQRTAINFMGCYAAFNAMKVADAFCKSGEAKVLIVCTEICSLHFQKGDNEDDLLANALFGDGSAAVLVESTSTATKSLEISEYQCDVLPSGKQEMAWSIGDFGFEMKLSSYVPYIIQNGINHLLKRIDQSYDFYAIHPGGKKILKVIEEALDISKDQNTFSHEILKTCGNMSSPTILFVIKKVFDALSESDDHKSILAMAFGPGLTLESMTLNVKYA